ncbi:MAG: hypothetical protein LLG14_00690 [Nocardiaceae bacterium]|nr:hypothetical protein [Nocardiaceae bacterium]
MTPRRADTRPWGRRTLVRTAMMFGLALSIVLMAIGPGNLASALGGGAPKAPFDPIPFPQTGWRIANNPLHLTTKSLEIYGMSKAYVGDRIRMANGQLSPEDTIYMKVRKLELDDVKITSERPTHTWLMQNLNGGKDNKAQTFTIGNDVKSTTVELWVTINQLKLCVTPQTFYTIVNSEKGQFQGRLDEVFALIAEVFKPYTEGPLKNVGPCIPIKETIPLVAVLVNAGVPLPELPAIKGDMMVYATKITTPIDQPAIHGPITQVRMFQ